jgi:hypothetical protein
MIFSRIKEILARAAVRLLLSYYFRDIPAAKHGAKALVDTCPGGPFSA